MSGALLAARLAATLALAAPGATSPKALALQLADFPSGTRSTVQFTTPAGIAKAYSVTFNVRDGAREEAVTTMVAVARNSANAHRMYAITVGGATGMQREAKLRLPSYGDEQTATFLSNAQLSHGDVIVRKGNVVWHLEIESCGALAMSGCVFGRTPPKLTKAQALAALTRYASKQKTRVGNG